MKKLFGNTTGLKASQIGRLENIYRHRIPPESLVTLPLAQELCALSFDIRRQIGFLADRAGKIIFVVIGDHNGIMLPDTSAYRTPPGRLKGLKYVHTHINNEALTKDDLTDLALLRLDLIAAITLSETGRPREVHLATIFPGQSATEPCQVHPPVFFDDLDVNCLSLVHAIETELSRMSALHDVDPGVERAILISVTPFSKARAEASIAELKELARSNHVFVVDTVIQHRKKLIPGFCWAKENWKN
ncbi:MAG: hypothetical protein R2860_06450 [Desulfobacterales bacterium]